jgi:hypothetical protein
MSLLKKRDTFLLLIALCFAGKYLIIDSWKFHANDFAPIYVAAQSVADGKHISIYDHHPYLFNIVPPGEFKETATKIGFKGILHPYLHLPLVSFLCRFLLFIPYRIIIKLLLLINFLTTLLSLHLILKLIGRGFDLRWLSITILAMAYFYPMRYSYTFRTNLSTGLFGNNFHLLFSQNWPYKNIRLYTGSDHKS